MSKLTKLILHLTIIFTAGLVLTLSTSSSSFVTSAIAAPEPVDGGDKGDGDVEPVDPEEDDPITAAAKAAAAAAGLSEDEVLNSATPTKPGAEHGQAIQDAAADAEAKDGGKDGGK